MDMFERILVATDLTSVSAPALATALQLARAHGAAVTAVYVNERHREADHWLVPFFEDEVQAYTKAQLREEEEARRRLDRAVAAALVGATLAQPRVLRVVGGRAAEAIVAAAIEARADLIVVGTHGQGNVLGSVAERVVRTAGRPVLVVPAKRA
jgi:nucleotide-binding universal stress UspA family protein